MNNDIAVLLTSHPGHRIFMKECLYYWSQMAKEYPIVMGWDDSTFLWHHSFPAGINLFTTGKRLGLTLGELTQFKIGVKILGDIYNPKYILKGSADFFIRDWYRIPNLIEEITEISYLASPSQPIESTVGTHIFFAKMTDLQNVLDTMEINKNFCEHQIKTGLVKCGYSSRMELFSWWQRKLGYVDLQMGWTKKMNKRYELCWNEGENFYDITELQIFGRRHYSDDPNIDEYLY